ncbi:MAG: hypothetical protein ACK5CF_03820 [Opitutaceae bacterium]
MKALRSLWRAGFLFAALLPLPLLAEMPAPLQAAVDKLIADTDHWAYTQEVREYSRRGEPEGGPTIERYDPSKPDEEQWSLRLYKGRIPSESDVRSWKRRKEREMRRRERPLGEVMDFDRAALLEERGEAYVYRVPIKPGVSRRLPSDKFEVVVQVGKVRSEIERVTVRALGGFRLSGVAGLAARVDRVEIDAVFAVVDPAYAAQPSRINAEGAGKVAWVFRVGGRAEIAWSEVTRVKPYKDRFGVEIGDVKALDF